MTALAGCVFDPETGSRPRLEAMLAAQAPYGRFDAVVRLDEDAAIGVRPSYLLPEDRFDPPILSDEQGRMLCADVRLDDRAGLSATLGIDPDSAKRMSDSALLFATLARWGVAGLARAEGDFALALWDPRQRALTLARDFGGQKPLYFHTARHRIAFASMPCGLRALGDVPRAPDLTQLLEFLALEPEADDRSFFVGIAKIRPGYAVTFTPGGIREQKLWTPSAATLRLNSDGEYVEALRERMDAAVSARLRGADGGVGCQLSSGLDSGTVTATAARLLAEEQRELTAFTAVPRAGFVAPDPRHLADEGPLAAEYARLYPNLHHVLVHSRGSPLADLEGDARLFQRPMLNPVNMSWIKAILGEAQQRGIGVLLTGARGNMSFSYSGMTALPGWLKRGAIERWAHEAAALQRSGTPWRQIAAQSFGPSLPRPLWSMAMQALGRVGQGQPSANGFEARVRSLSGVDYGNYAKGMFGGWGVDVRDPTSDRRLLQFCLSLPEDQFLRGGEQRSIARRAMADRLPAAILAELKRGYQAADWFEAMAGERHRAMAEIAAAHQVPELHALADLPLLNRLVASWPKNWRDPRLIADYRLTLPRRLAVLAFARLDWPQTGVYK